MLSIKTISGITAINIGLVIAVANSIINGVSTTDITLFVVFYLISAFGITIGYHRYFAHMSFKTNKIMKYTLCILGSMAGQGNLKFWVGSHRIHHHFTDRDGDPHSPVLNKGFSAGLKVFFIHTWDGYSNRYQKRNIFK